MIQKETRTEKKQEGELRIGAFICECGVNIAGTVDCQKVADYVSTMPNVTTSVVNKYTCSDAGDQRSSSKPCACSIMHAQDP